MEKRVRQKIRFGSSENGVYGKLNKVENDLSVNKAALVEEINRAFAAETALKSSVDATEECIKMLMNEVFPLKIFLSHSPNSTAEFTGSAKNFTLTWTYENVAEADIESLKLTIGSETVNLPLPGDANYSKSYTVSVADDTTCMITVGTSTNSVTANTKINFAYRSYSGVVAPDFAINENSIKALEQTKLVDSKAQAYTYGSYTNKKVVFAYAKVYGALTQVIGPLNSDYLYMFEQKTARINDMDYYVYIYKTESSIGGSLTYNYK